MKRLVHAGRGAPPARDVEVNPRVLVFDKLGLHVLNRRISSRRPPAGGSARDTAGPAKRLLEGSPGEVGQERYGAPRPSSIRLGRGAGLALPWHGEGTRRSLGAHVPRPPITVEARGTLGFRVKAAFLGGRSRGQRIWSAARGARKPAGASAIGRPARALSADGAEGPRRAFRVATGTSDQSWRTLTASPIDAGQAGANLAGPSSKPTSSR